jgi:hypothetical protein
MTDEEITKAAREICAEQARKSSGEESQNYLNGNYDHTVWMRLVEQGIRKGIEQHEAFKQKVSDIVKAYVNGAGKNGGIDEWVNLKSLIITKPDPLVDVAESLGYFNTAAKGWAGDVRAKLEARGLEIREKGQ